MIFRIEKKKKKFKCCISRKPKYPFLDLIQRWHFGTLIHFGGKYFAEILFTKLIGCGLVQTVQSLGIDLTQFCPKLLGYWMIG